MRILSGLWICVVVMLVQPAAAGDVTLVVSDTDGAAGRVGVPVSVKVDLAELFGSDAKPNRLRLAELAGAENETGKPLPMQFDEGTLWWLMPPGAKGQRRFRLTLSEHPGPAALEMRINKKGEYFDVAQGRLPVLRYNHGTVPVPKGTKKHFAAGESYDRGDYISPLFGPAGEVLSQDYPADHAHHRGVWWSWPVVRWGDQVGDIWAVVRVHARPVAVHRVVTGGVLALLEAENVWKWEDKEPIVREEVVIRAFRQSEAGRYMDVEVRLTGLVDDVAIGGRPKRGYGGFALRAAPGEDQKIVLHSDPAGSNPRRAWIDYSAVFPGGKGQTGIAIFEHVTNPDYPSQLQEYGNINCVMSAFPGDREVPLPKGKTLVLKHRLWIHSGSTDEKTLSDVWAAYASPPKVALVK